MPDAPVRLQPPVPPLADEAVELRPWRDDDVDGVTRACQDAAISRWTTAPDPYTRADAEAFVALTRQAWEQGRAACFAIVGAGDGELLGSIDLRVPDGGVTGVVGYWVAAWGRGRGVATRALVLLAEWAHGPVGLEATVLEIYEGNDASVRVAEKAGYHLAGKVEVAHDGDGRAALLYSRLSDDA